LRVPGTLNECTHAAELDENHDFSEENWHAWRKGLQQVRLCRDEKGDCDYPEQGA
jgi:hypothetical protein